MSMRNEGQSPTQQWLDSLTEGDSIKLKDGRHGKFVRRDGGEFTLNLKSGGHIIPMTFHPDAIQIPKSVRRAP